VLSTHDTQLIKFAGVVAEGVAANPLIPSTAARVVCFILPKTAVFCSPAFRCFLYVRYRKSA
jgi:hypothetical protein